MEGQIRSARPPVIRGLCQSKLLARDGAGCQGDTPPSSRTMAQPIHSCDVSNTANSDAVLYEPVCCGTVQLLVRGAPSVDPPCAILSLATLHRLPQTYRLSL